MQYPMLLTADHITHHYQGNDQPVLALRDVSLQVARGEFVALVGPSGCGKTTLLRMFAGLLTPEQGTITYGGVPLTAPPHDVGVVFQKPALLPWRTVRDNIALPDQVDHHPPDMNRIEALMAQVGLTDFATAAPDTLSGGMQQRVALARALVQSPRLLLLDEPFGALDMMLRHDMNDLLLDLWHTYEPTVVFVTHDLHEAVYLADRVVTMSPRPGRIVGAFDIPLPRPRKGINRYGAEIQGQVELLWESIAKA